MSNDQVSDKDTFNTSGLYCRSPPKVNFTIETADSSAAEQSRPNESVSNTQSDSGHPLPEKHVIDSSTLQPDKGLLSTDEVVACTRPKPTDKILLPELSTPNRLDIHSDTVAALRFVSTEQKAADSPTKESSSSVPDARLTSDNMTSPEKDLITCTEYLSEHEKSGKRLSSPELAAQSQEGVLDTFNASKCDDTVHLRKRRKRNRKSGKPQNVNIDDYAYPLDNADDVKEEVSVESIIHQPFHRILFDENGEPCDVVPKARTSQVNRRQQKRLGTSNYNWSANTQDISSVNVDSTLPQFAAKRLRGQRKPNKRPENLVVRIHRFPNDYETVTNYWYTTLEWLDRKAVEMATEPEQYPMDFLDEFESAMEADLNSRKSACDTEFDSETVD